MRKNFHVDKAEPNIVWSIQMPRSMYNELQRLAKKTGKSRAELVREMVEFCLDELRSES
jgi:predicted DNA-binding protein